MVINVSYSGDDRFSGSKDKPVKTLKKALELSRALSGARTIYILDGIFEDVSITLDERDNGLEIRGDGNSLLCGGISISNWVKCDDGSYVTKLPDDVSKNFRLITVNGEMRERAKYPVEGHLKYLSRFDSKWMSTSAGGWDVKPTYEELTTLIYDPADIRRDFSWKSADITVFHKWDDSMSSICAFEPEKNTFRLSEELTHPPGGFGTTNYVIWNTKEGLIPGKWRVDKLDGMLYYMPFENEDITAAQVFIPTQESIISLTGEINSLTLDGLHFMITSNPATPCGFGTSRLPGAVNSSAKLTDCTFKNLWFTALSGWGINLIADYDYFPEYEEKPEGNTNVIIKNCEITNTGGGGIQLRGNTGCLIQGNKISKTGRIYYSAIGITANNCDIIDNELSDLTYSGIVLGKGRGTRISGNRINNAINLLNDGAGIYVTFCENGIMSNNIVENISSDGPQSQRHGLYTDEQANNWILEGNITINCPSAYLSHMNYREGNILRNNTFICYDREVMVLMIRCKNHHFESNTFHAAGPVIIAGGRGSVTGFDNNRLYSVEGKTQHRYVSDEYVWDDAIDFDGINPLE